MKLTLILFAFAFLFYLTLSLYAKKKEREVYSLWKKEGIDLIQKKTQLRETKENESAKEIFEIAKKLDIFPHLDEEVYKSKYSDLYDYVIKQLEEGKLEFVKIDENTIKHLDEIKENFFKLCEIVEKENPIWEMNDNSTNYATVLINLSRLLSAETLYCLSEGKINEALTFFKTTVSLGESIEPQSIIESIIKMAFYKYIYGCARFFPYLDDELVDRLSTFVPVYYVREGFINEAIKINFSENLKSLSEEKVSFLSLLFAKPYLKLEYSEYLRYYLLGIKAIERESPCELSEKNITKKILEEMPKWSIISKVAMPNLEDVWVRAYHLEIEKELVFFALLVKKEKAQKRSFPEKIEIKKSICPDTFFDYSTEGERIKITFNGNFSGKLKRPIIPLNWEE